MSETLDLFEQPLAPAPSSRLEIDPTCQGAIFLRTSRWVIEVVDWLWSAPELSLLRAMYVRRRKRETQGRLQFWSIADIEAFLAAGGELTGLPSPLPEGAVFRFSELPRGDRIADGVAQVAPLRSLSEVREMAEAFMRRHAPADFTFGFDRAAARLGLCDYGSRRISLSERHALYDSDDEVMDTIIHEVAHSLTPGAHHGKEWRDMFLGLGGSGERTGQQPSTAAVMDMLEKDAVCVTGSVRDQKLLIGKIYVRAPKRDPRRARWKLPEWKDVPIRVYRPLEVAEALAEGRLILAE